MGLSKVIYFICRSVVDYEHPNSSAFSRFVNLDLFASISGSLDIFQKDE